MKSPHWTHPLDDWLSPSDPYFSSSYFPYGYYLPSSHYRTYYVPSSYYHAYRYYYPFSYYYPFHMHPPSSRPGYRHSFAIG
jgi:hypothetical protein